MKGKKFRLSKNFKDEKVFPAELFKSEHKVEKILNLRNQQLIGFDYQIGIVENPTTWWVSENKVNFIE